ncbi:MAG: DUF1003 domain-containing protein [Alphaproteobacteria bacterium]|nr:DUF1003 domain-containing protein [Alphaproteobacteria bacterium]
MTLKYCCICKREFERKDLFPVELLKPSLLDLIVLHHTLAKNDYICIKDRTHFYREWRKQQIQESAHICNLSDIGLKSFDDILLNAKTYEELEEARLTFGQMLADRVTAFAGSWSFIISFFIFLALWMISNSYIILFGHFDVYPYIFLNLILSCLAAVQAPVIIMSQNRQEARDRLRAELDYHINLQAGLEIRDISAKLDHIGQTIWEKTLTLETMIREKTTSEKLTKDIN